MKFVLVDDIFSQFYVPFGFIFRLYDTTVFNRIVFVLLLLRIIVFLVAGCIPGLHVSAGDSWFGVFPYLFTSISNEEYLRE